MEDKKNYYGLNDQQVIKSREENGLNILSPPKREPLWKLFLEKFEDPIIRILLIAAFLSLGISFVHWEFAETIGIFCAILLATGVAFWFELDAIKKFDILNKVKDDEPIQVIRNGKVGEVLKKEIVVGDIVLLNTGGEVPADGELLESVSLMVDESCLTGEPSTKKTTNPQFFSSESTYPSNHLLRGSKILDGHCIFKVNNVGDNTDFGDIAKRISEKNEVETPLDEQLNKLADSIAIIGLFLAAFTFITRFLKDILAGDVAYTIIQIGLISGVLMTFLIILAKVWLPIVYNGFKLIGREKKLPRIVDGSTWFDWETKEKILEEERLRIESIKLTSKRIVEKEEYKKRIEKLDNKKTIFSFLQLCTIGLIFFFIWLLIGFVFGVNPFLMRNWISVETAGHILQYFMISVTLIVVAVPEGLPMSVTLSLALSMRKMLKSNNLVRKMHACETMGATTVICTDKTGTLTRNQMRVYTTNFFGLDGKSLKQSQIGNIITEGIATNTTAHLDFSDPNKIRALGNPTEAALLLWLQDENVDYKSLRDNARLNEQLTFSPERKYMASIVESPLLNKKVLYVKGAPEIVLSKCRYVQYEDSVKTVEQSEKAVLDLLDLYQKQAMRTLGFAYEIIDDEKERIFNGDLINVNLTFIGVTAISDPLRTDVPDAVKTCLDAGINVKIITGDTPGTAKEISRQIGILSENDESNAVITGAEFAALNDENALELIHKLKVMCRARPGDKQRFVQLLQRSGSVVAVTGDGTNDAPALNHAHVGLSMGTGTIVAKEASDITLIDDSFSSITNAVLWGRSIYRNIQRFIVFQLTINVAALIIDFFGAIFWGKLPLTVTQLLWINLIMDTFAAGALASLPPDPKVMKDKPRDRNSFIVNKQMASFIFGVGLLFVVLLLGLLEYFTVTDYFNTNEPKLSTKELTAFFTFFVMLQFWNMFNAKAFFSGKSAFNGLFKSVGFLIVGSAILIGQFSIVEFGGKVFRTVPLTFSEWLIIITTSSIVLWIGELVRLFSKNKTVINNT